MQWRTAIFKPCSMATMDIKIIASTRIDKFLWAARFYKTRSLATDAIGKGRVKINGQLVKAAREVRAGDSVALLRDGMVCTINVLQVSEQRGPAPQAQTLYLETPESLAAAQAAKEQRQLQPEPALSITQGRPTKRQRRDLDQAKQSNSGWGDRWSASMDD
jgi:ribosome-associated heat shock protein Hsp15